MGRLAAINTRTGLERRRKGKEATARLKEKETKRGKTRFCLQRRKHAMTMRSFASSQRVAVKNQEEAYQTRTLKAPLPSCCSTFLAHPAATLLTSSAPLPFCSSISFLTFPTSSGSKPATNRSTSANVPST